MSFHYRINSTFAGNEIPLKGMGVGFLGMDCVYVCGAISRSEAEIQTSMNFGNMSVNNKQGSSDQCSVNPSSLACISLSFW